jgi:hypothetical protein
MRPGRCSKNNQAIDEPKGEQMRTRRIALLITLMTILLSCGPTPNPSQNGIWDQSNFEASNWN